MTSRERLQTAAEFREADRVPIELLIREQALELPECRRIADFVTNEADNFRGVSGVVDWGFFGLPAEGREEIIEDRPGEYRRLKRTISTPAGNFVAVTKHYYPHLDNPDFRWEKRYIRSLADLERLTDAPREARPVAAAEYQAGVERIAERGMPFIPRLHPLGTLVRSSTMEEVYGWLVTESKLVHRFLEKANRQVCETIRAMGNQGIAPWFYTWAHEMLIPPWLGRRHFEELVFPYDKQVHDTVHGIGGKVRTHCHGRCMHFLERMAEMGVDSIEPLEPPPYGDVILAEAKRLVGDRMLLSGNIPCQNFLRMSRKEVRESVKKAIADAAAGGGFTLRATGQAAGVNPCLERGMLIKMVDNAEAYVEAGLKYGRYL